MQASIARQPDLKVKGGKWVRPSVDVKLNPAEKSGRFIFQITDPSYSKVLSSVLKNLLSGLGR